MNWESLKDPVLIFAALVVFKVLEILARRINGKNGLVCQSIDRLSHEIARLRESNERLLESIHRLEIQIVELKKDVE